MANQIGKMGLVSTPKNQGRMIVEVGEGRVPVISFDPVGLITSGWLERIQMNMYRAADTAQATARRIAAKGDEDAPDAA